MTVRSLCPLLLFQPLAHVRWAVVFGALCRSVSASGFAPLYPHGSSACPCIYPWANLTNPFAVRGNKTCLETSFGACYPTSYGSSTCNAHDTDLPREAFEHDSGSEYDQCHPDVLSQPEWCRTPFCWVDPNNCHREHSQSSYFVNRTDLVPSYSYQTCGFTNTYSEDWRGLQLRGKRFRVAFPGDDDSGYTLLTDEAGNKRGSFVEFMNRLASTYKFVYVPQEISNVSRTKFPSSSFTACVHDVAINHTDLCIANFWLTAQRRALTTMTAPLSTDDMYLVTPEAGDISRYALLLRQVRETHMAPAAHQWPTR
jgi:hypothetical protein